MKINLEVACYTFLKITSYMQDIKHQLLKFSNDAYADQTSPLTNKVLAHIFKKNEISCPKRPIVHVLHAKRYLKPYLKTYFKYHLFYKVPNQIYGNIVVKKVLSPPQM